MKKWLHKLALRFIINEHKKWIDDKHKGIRLNFSNADLEGAIFTNTNISASIFDAGNIRNRQKEDMIRLFNEIHKIDNDATRIHLRNLMIRLEVQDPHERIR